MNYFPSTPASAALTISTVAPAAAAARAATCCMHSATMPPASSLSLCVRRRSSGSSSAARFFKTSALPSNGHSGSALGLLALGAEARSNGA
eukprot:CAMPEP_0180038828 /NCGR_PEP_ID=MMETSP0984-20121128/32439_1 /TAXON_ID=483367 /ORGANISM="non described non described, Strain CCMP 2436" /LENGTH=90 /DNA_ID=CAMNT_0021965637 /DNA_START=1 /DNA_END=273 /DNA_ORIENTATION=-